MSLVVGDRTVMAVQCPLCGRSYSYVKGFVWRDTEPWAVYFAACHGHPKHEASIDVILGTWGEDIDDDHITFSCQAAPDGARAVDAPVAADGKNSIFGRMLSREDALAHDRVADFWAIVDALVEQDPDVRGESGLAIGSS
jgi:hypothetical protein